MVKEKVFAKDLDLASKEELFAKALSYAALKHQSQKRIGGTPYIYHPMKVAEIVKDAGYGLEYQIVAILHDTLEDTDATEEEILQFGDDVLEAVILLTRIKGMDENAYVNEILKNKMAAVVKNADKIGNLCDAAYCEDRKWAKRYLGKAKRYYQGKFSKALDYIILAVEDVLEHDVKEKTPFPIYWKGMKLYNEN